jgi:hypothetical protein
LGRGGLFAAAAPAAAALGNLAGDAALAHRIAEEPNAVAGLVQLLDSWWPEDQETAAAALRQMVRGAVSSCTTIMHVPGLATRLHALLASGNGTAPAKAAASMTLQELGWEGEHQVRGNCLVPQSLVTSLSPVQQAWQPHVNASMQCC